jgi:hypothetical protein
MFKNFTNLRFIFNFKGKEENGTFWLFVLLVVGII